jgi:hypothetical protein
MATLALNQTKYAPYEEYANPCYGFLTWLPRRDGRHGTHGPVPVNSSLRAGRRGRFPGDILMAQGMGGQVGVPDAQVVRTARQSNAPTRWPMFHEGPA